MFFFFVCFFKRESVQSNLSDICTQRWKEQQHLGEAKWLQTSGVCGGSAWPGPDPEAVLGDPSAPGGEENSPFGRRSPKNIKTLPLPVKRIDCDQDPWRGSVGRKLKKSWGLLPTLPRGVSREPGQSGGPGWSSWRTWATQTEREAGPQDPHIPRNSSSRAG